VNDSISRRFLFLFLATEINSVWNLFSFPNLEKNHDSSIECFMKHYTERKQPECSKIVSLKLVRFTHDVLPVPPVPHEFNLGFNIV